MNGKLKIKKAIASALLFSVAFSAIQTGSIRVANAAQTSASSLAGTSARAAGTSGTAASTRAAGNSAENDRSFVEEVNISTNLVSDLIVDTRNDGVMLAENISLGTDRFVIESRNPSNYKVTSAVSRGAMSLSKGGTTTAPSYTFSGIKNYNDFYMTIKVLDINTNVTKTYKVLFKFDIESLLQFDNIRLTYTDSENSTSTALVSYNSASDDGYYRQSVGSDAASVKVELLDGNTTITSGVSVKSDHGGSASKINLIGGDNIITIKITKNNVSKEYSLIIYKEGEASLKSLTPSTGKLSPAFDPSHFDYDITVPTTQNTIAFTATSVDNASTIKINNAKVKSGKKSSDIKLSEGSNKVSVQVTTREGKTTSYVINVNRTEKFRSSNLRALKLSSGTLSPTFNKDIYEYTATVENKITSISVTPTAEDTESEITINGVKSPSGAVSKSINLDEGSNTINIVVTDSKGDSNTYVVNVNRKYPKDNVNLSALTVTDGTMSPSFDPENYLYSVKVARNIEKIRVKFTAQNEKAKIKVYKTGTTPVSEYTSGQESELIPIELGANLVNVEVTSEDGKKITTYKLSIIRDKIEGVNQWVLVAGEWTFYNAYGIQVKNEWVKYDNEWYFLDINGYMQTGWIVESGNWYYLNSDGIMQTGWLYDNGYWYYLQGDGALRTNGWATYWGDWYFFNASGAMQTGWTFYKGYWYYLDEHGVMQKGWIKYDKNKYYLNDDGSMRTGWLYDGNKWYYLDDTGMMVHGWYTIDGTTYYFGSNGAMKTGMMFLDGHWYNLGK